MFDIIESILLCLKFAIIGGIGFSILMLIVIIIKSQLDDKKSAISDTYENKENNFFTRNETMPSSAPESKVSVSITAEMTSTYPTGRKWDDISQSEIDSVKCYGDNMSKHDYKIRAKYIPTNRMRTVKINAFTEDDALSQLDPEFDADSATISFCEYPHPTERQIQYAIYSGIQIPEKCCQYDLSVLLDRHTDQPAPVTLTEFALSRKLCFSYYGDEPYLIGVIGSDMEMQEWIAFALACMNRHINKVWDFSQWEEYMEYSLECMNNTSFMNSLKRTHFKDEFGEFYGFEYSACSHDTIFYKTLHRYIVEHSS